MIPRTNLGFQKAMDDGKNKSVNSPNPAITSETLVRLDVIQPEYNQKILAMNIAKQAQIKSTKNEEIAQEECHLYISHFFQSFNMGIARGIFPANARVFYGLDASQTALPELTKENDVLHWASAIVKGEAARVAEGGAPMIFPAAAEVNDKLLIYKAAHNSQSEMKDAFTNAQQAVSAMYDTVKKIVVDMWDEIEFYFRTEPDEPAKRRRCREWGVVYYSRMKAKINGTVTESGTGAPLEGVQVLIAETDESVFTDAEGKYLISTNYTGLCTLEFTLAGYTDTSVEVEIHEGAEISQDVQMKRE
jgi:hypothetical protein